MKKKIKGIVSFFLRIGLSAGLLWFVFSKVDVEKTVQIIKTAEIKYICIAGFLFLVCNVIILLRWFLFIHGLKVEARLFTIMRYYFMGLFGNLFLPSSIGGDIIKIYGLCKETSKKTRVFASVLLDRLSGFASIVIVSVCSFTFGYNVIEDKSLLIPILILAVSSFALGAVLFNEKLYSFGCKLFNRFSKIKNIFMQIHYDISLMRESWGDGVKAILMSCLSQLVFAMTFYFSAKALHQDVSFVYFLIFVPLICVAASVPSIGGLGVREAGAAYLFGLAGVDSGVAVSLSLISFLFMIIVGLLGGVFYVFTLSSRRIQFDPSDAETDLKIET